MNQIDALTLRGWAAEMRAHRLTGAGRCR